MATKNGLEFEDGSSIEGSDLPRLLNIVKQRAKEGKSKPVQVRAEGIAINVRGFEPKAGGKVNMEHANYVEGNYKGWKIRVWKIAKDKMYGCNYFQEEDVRYLEVPQCDVLDENGVFKYVQVVIDDL